MGKQKAGIVPAFRHCTVQISYPHDFIGSSTYPSRKLCRFGHEFF